MHLTDQQSAALLGLIFVGMSINLVKITAQRELPERGAEAIVLFGSVLLVSIVTLVPQPRQALGIEVTPAQSLPDRGPWPHYAFVLSNVEPRYRRSFVVNIPSSSPSWGPSSRRGSCW